MVLLLHFIIAQWAKVIARQGPLLTALSFPRPRIGFLRRTMGGFNMESTTAEKICRRCKASYDPSSNSSSSCRFHTSFFVCRRHDDQKRYYELGPNDPPYAAKFYDCCGAEDPDASGCTTDFHVSYDD